MKKRKIRLDFLADSLLTFIFISRYVQPLPCDSILCRNIKSPKLQSISSSKMFRLEELWHPQMWWDASQLHGNWFKSKYYRKILCQNHIKEILWRKWILQLATRPDWWSCSKCIYLRTNRTYMSTHLCWSSSKLMHQVICTKNKLNYFIY